MGLVWECRLREAPNSWFEIFDSFEIFQTQKTAFKISHKLPLTVQFLHKKFTISTETFRYLNQNQKKSLVLKSSDIVYVLFYELKV